MPISAIIPVCMYALHTEFLELLTLLVRPNPYEQIIYTLPVSLHGISYCRRLLRVSSVHRFCVREGQNVVFLCRSHLGELLNPLRPIQPSLLYMVSVVSLTFNLTLSGTKKAQAILPNFTHYARYFL
jgi:hypothetical protein